MVQLENRAAASTGRQGFDRRGPVARIAAAVLLTGAAAIVIARWWTGTDYVPAPAGLPDPGQLTAIALPVSHFVSDAAGILVVGLLLVRSLSPNTDHGGDDHRLGNPVARWAWLWAGSTLAWILCTMSDMTGLPVAALPASTDLLVVVAGTQRILAEVATLWVAFALALYAGRLSGRPASVVAGCLAASALLPSALSGHVGHHNETALTITALGVHVLAAAVWIGGLLAIVLYLRAQPDRLAAVLPRFSRAALVCAAAVAVSGVIVSVVLLGSWTAILDSNRGHLIAAKAVALLVLVLIGYWHRRTTVRPAGRGDVRPLLRLAGVEVVLMGATIGVAVALSTTS